ncbi:hypothetical protein M0R45_009209 [Rubus argutus]|uniref:Uncharacterized protein n=1 Tax=Rubus argutus TaxID=59490 RepID=A0AAW1Y2X1_RUBAR
MAFQSINHNLTESLLVNGATNDAAMVASRFFSIEAFSILNVFNASMVASSSFLAALTFFHSADLVALVLDLCFSDRALQNESSEESTIDVQWILKRNARDDDVRALCHCVRSDDELAD